MCFFLFILCFKFMFKLIVCKNSTVRGWYISTLTHYTCIGNYIETSTLCSLYVFPLVFTSINQLFRAAWVRACAHAATLALTSLSIAASPLPPARTLPLSLRCKSNSSTFTSKMVLFVLTPVQCSILVCRVHRRVWPAGDSVAVKLPSVVCWACRYWCDESSSLVRCITPPTSCSACVSISREI